ncbi:MAG: M3 family metallopeptidase [Methanoregula sp.]|jgi:thimet oligopeptidase
MPRPAYLIVLFIVLFSLVFITGLYFPAGIGKTPLVPSTPTGVSPVTTRNPTEPVRSHYAPGEITGLCDAAISSANASFNEIAAIPPEKRTTDTTLLRFENTLAGFNDRVMPLTLMSYVYPDPAISAEGAACEEKAGMFTVGIYTRRDLYDAVRQATPRTAKESRLYNETLRQFKRNGLALPDDRLTHVRALKENLTRLEVQFSANLNNDNTTLTFSAGDLVGVPPEALATFKKTGTGTYLVTTKYPDYYAVMQNAKKSDTRKTMYRAFVNRQADENTRLLEEAILVRQEIAKELGYATWADYRIDGRMAGNKENVLAFLAELKEPLKEKTHAELSALLTVKQGLTPGATALDPWDMMYLNEQVRKQKYALDDETIRQYFPLDVVTDGMFHEFGPLFNVSFAEVPGAQVWSPDVKLYRVAGTTDNRTIAYIYFDLFPREGKYGHTMMVPLIAGRLVNGTYSVPVSVIVGNFRAPNGDIPSLLTHDDVDGLFHEFGHTLHASLTRAPYASLSGTNVEWDFVETPSQAMEEWTWQPEVIDTISGLYTNHTQKLPADIRDRIIAARDMDAGQVYTRMLMISSEDMEFHTAQGPVDVTGISDRMYADLMGIPPIQGGHEPATIGHFMGGYDAGYYSYLWSKVYALNVFERFRQDGLANTTTGMSYRHWILEPGNMQDGNTLLRGFLGKEPGMNVFYERLNISADGNSRTKVARS